MDRRVDPGSVQAPAPDPVRSGVEPLDVDGTRTVLVGTVLWAVAFVVLLPFWDRLEADGRLWWLWTCAAGFALGLLGWLHCLRRARRRRRGRPRD